MPQTFDILDFNAVLETGHALLLHPKGFALRTSRNRWVPGQDDQVTDKVFQDFRPRLDLTFKYTGGLGQFFALKGVQCEAGTVPDVAHAGVINIELITLPDIAQHSILLGTLRRHFQTVVPLLNALYKNKSLPALQKIFILNIVEDPAAFTFADNQGYYTTTLAFKTQFTINHLWLNPGILATVTPNIFSGLPIAFGCNNFPAKTDYPEGDYSVNFDSGAMKFNHNFGWQVNRPQDGHQFTITYSDGKITMASVNGNANNGYATQADCEAANAGQKIGFHHRGGPITMRLEDDPYSDNVAGNPIPTFNLYAINSGFVAQSITL